MPRERLLRGPGGAEAPLRRRRLERRGDRGRGTARRAPRAGTPPSGGARTRTRASRLHTRAREGSLGLGRLGVRKRRLLRVQVQARGWRVDRLVHAGERKRVAEGRRLLGGAPPRRGVARAARRRRTATPRHRDRMASPPPRPEETASDASAHNPRVARVRSGTLPSSAAARPHGGCSRRARKSLLVALEDVRRAAGAISASARRGPPPPRLPSPRLLRPAARRLSRLSRACARARSRASYGRGGTRRASRASPPPRTSRRRRRRRRLRRAAGRRAARVRRTFVVDFETRAVPPQTRLPAFPRALHVLHGVPVPAPRAPIRRGARDRVDRRLRAERATLAPSSAKRLLAASTGPPRAPRVPRASPPRRRSRAGPRPPRTRERPWPRARGACSAARARRAGDEDSSPLVSRQRRVDWKLQKNRRSHPRAGPRGQDASAQARDAPDLRASHRKRAVRGTTVVRRSKVRSLARVSVVDEHRSAARAARVPETVAPGGAGARSAVTTADSDAIVATSSKRTRHRSARSVSMGAAAIQRRARRVPASPAVDRHPPSRTPRVATPPRRRASAPRRSRRRAGALRWRVAQRRKRSSARARLGAPGRRALRARPRTPRARGLPARVPRVVSAVRRGPRQPRAGGPSARVVGVDLKKFNASVAETSRLLRGWTRAGTPRRWTRRGGAFPRRQGAGARGLVSVGGGAGGLRGDAGAG